MTDLHVHRASRLEALAAAAREVLASTRPADPLAPQTMVVAHAGIARWLRQFLVLHPGDSPGGARGIVANLDLVLPFEWLDRLECELLEAGAAPEWQRESLRWRIDALLPQMAAAPELADRLTGEESARHRFRLADRLAALFTQYLLYRRDTVAAWERGRDTHWQASLWRQLRNQIEGQHRGDTMQALLAALTRGMATAAAHAPELLFGFNHLPVDHLQLVDALAQRGPVHLFHLTPTFALWGDIATERAIAEADDAEALHLESGHPLLAALGGHGQVLASMLEAHAGEPGFGDALDAAAPLRTDRLGRLQRSLRELDASPGIAEAVTHASALHDASLRVHSCATHLRELEVLRDAILDRMVADPTLTPRDIIVMAPDIERYAPLLPAVFGDPEFERWLPYQCSDRPLGALHPLLARVDALLSLDQVRFGVDDLLDLLELPALARRFDVEPRTVEAIAHWARESGVSWGLDGHDRERVTAGASNAPTRHSWQFALDRVTAGHLRGASEILLANVLPLGDDDASSGDALRVLASLLRSLQEWRDLIAIPRSVAQWAAQLRRNLIGALFAPAREDDASRAALAQLETAIAGVVTEARMAGRSDPVAFDAVRESLRGLIRGVGARQPFLGGGIAVCGMVPARALPFRMVCVLGLNDGEFPRNDSGRGLDLMQAPGAWRRGDRSQRDEDRYLFLESVLSARHVLHLSWRGISPVNGDAQTPSSPLAELMSWLDGEHAHTTLQAGIEPVRPWLFEHAIQPFAPRAFERSGSGLSAFDTRLYDAARAVRVDPLPWPPFLQGEMQPLREHDCTRGLSVNGIVRWLREPGRAFLRDTLEVEQPWFEDQHLAEPLDRALPRHAADTLRDAAIAHFWAHGRLPLELPDRIAHSGLMPPDPAAQHAFESMIEGLAKTEQAIAQRVPDSAFGAQLRTVEVRWQGADGAADLRGAIGGYVPAAALLRRELWQRAPTVGDVLAGLFEWSLLRLEGLQHADGPAPDRELGATRLLLWPALTLRNGLSIGGLIEPSTVPPQRLAVWVDAVCAQALQAQRSPLLLPPRTATAWISASKSRGQADRNASAAWFGGDRMAGESEFSQWSLLLRGRELVTPRGDAEPVFDPEFKAAAEWAQGLIVELLEPSQ